MSKNVCECCGEPTRNRMQIMCANCLSAKHLIQKSVFNMMKIHGAPMASGMCVDCGSRPAVARDHRHYGSPLKVDYVCSPCNIRRGQAFDLKELILAHRGINGIAVDTEHIDEDTQPIDSKFPIDLNAMLAQREQELILDALKETRWNITKASKLLTLSFRTLRYRMELYGITAAR